MTRYFFDIFNGHLHCDTLGEDLPDDAHAWREALHIVRDVEDMLTPGGTWRLDVRAGQAPIYRIKVEVEHLGSDTADAEPKDPNRAAKGTRRLSEKGPPGNRDRKRSKSRVVRGR